MNSKHFKQKNIRKDNRGFFAEILGLDGQRKWLYFLYAFLLIVNLPIVFKMFENLVGLHSLNDYSDAIFITIALIGCCKVFIKSIHLIDILFLVFIVAWHQFSPHLFPDTTQYSVENAEFFIFKCLPLFLVGLTFEAKQIKNVFVLMSWIALVLQIGLLAIYGMGYDENGKERVELMGVAYDFLPFALILLWQAFESHGLFDIIVSIVAVFLELSLGTRGPIVCIGFFVAFYFLVFRTYKRNTLIKSLIVCAAGVFYLFSTEIVLFLRPIALSFGLSTRVFDNFLEGNLANYSESGTRDDIYEITLQTFSKHDVVWGEGLYSDRIFSQIGRYCHNFEIEIICAFGWVGGLIILLLLFGLCIKVYYKYKNTNTGILLLIFFCSSILQLQFSNSFLILPIFWFFLGMCVSLNRRPVVNEEATFSKHP